VPAALRPLPTRRSSDLYVAPVAYYARQEREFRPLLLDLINLRASLLPTERYVEEAYDPYSFIRDGFRQRRWYAIYDGEPPEELRSEEHTSELQSRENLV